MSHECDGDCQATAEWRQQQIHDLTERAEKAEKALTETREQLRDAQVRLDEQRRMTDEAEAAAERRLDQSIMWTDRAEVAENALARVREVLARDLIAALGDAS